jgi:collagenase-like PrtC family protease
MGVKLDILFNANCYGAESTSNKLANKVLSIIDYLNEKIDGVEIATTTSPAIAHVIKTNFPDIEVRASVNMKIGTVKGMQYVSDLFDSFHIQREFNRDLERIKELKAWADANEKRLIMLANSGCMAHCSGQIFHDNLVAHESEIVEQKNIPDWNFHACWRYLKNKENWSSVLQNTWVRPEDLHNYEPFFDVAKLATRMHSNPAMVIRAYATGKYNGNLLDLFEPGFGPAFFPWMINNSDFPSDWFETTSRCDKKCFKCNYCKEVLKKVLTKENKLA